MLTACALIVLVVLLVVLALGGVLFEHGIGLGIVEVVDDRKEMDEWR